MALTKVTSGLISADASSVDLNIDAGTLYIDATNNKVGIGNSSPANNSSVANNLVVGNGTAGGIANYVGANLGWYAFSRDNANNTDAYDGGMSYDGSRNLKFHTNAGTERLTINGAGDMHLGQSDGDVKFYIGSQGGGFGGNASHNIRASSNQLMFNAGGSTGLYTFEVNGSEKMRLDSSGNMLVGTTSNSRGGRAVINGSAGDILKLSGGASGYLGLYITQNQANNHIYCDNLSTAQFYVTTSTGDYYFSGGSLSDRDLKENIASVPDGSLDLIKALTPRTFNFKAEENFSTKIKTGFIAQEVAEVITEGNVATGTDGQKDMAVDTTGIVAHLVKAIQEQQVLIEQLQAEVALLKGE